MGASGSVWGKEPSPLPLSQGKPGPSLLLLASVTFHAELCPHTY